MFLLKLPTSIQVDIFTKWINFYDLLQFETSLNNRHNLTLFRRLLREESFILKRLPSDPSTELLRWLFSREVRMESLTFPPTSLCFMMEQYPRANFSKLNKLTISSVANPRNGGAVSVVASGNAGTAVDVDHDCFQKLLVKCTELREIEFKAVAYSSFGKIGMLCPKLQAISVSACDGFNDTALESIAEHCTTKIQFLKLSNCCQLTSASVLSIATNCTDLVHLDISYCLAFTERSLLQLAVSCRRLQHLNCECLSNVTDTVVETFARHCPALQHVNIDYCKGSMRGGISPTTLRTLLEHCPQLEAYITLDFNYRINYRRGRRSMLRLKGCYFHQHEMVEIFNNCPMDLQIINAIECRKFGDACLAAVASRFGAQLQVLQARHSIGISDAGITAFAAQCPQLQIFDISSSKDISDIALQALADHCLQLRGLFINTCRYVTSNGITAIARQCRELQILDISHCEQITDSSIIALAMHSQGSLMYIDISNCNRISDRAVVNLATACSKMRGLRVHSKIQPLASASISYYRERFPEELWLGKTRSEWMKEVNQLF